MTLAKDETLEAILGNLGADPIYEIDSLAATGATGGSMQPTFVWDGITWTMPAVAYNATAAQVQAAVQQAVGAGNELMPAEAAVCSGGPLNAAAVQIRFQGAIVGPVSAQTVTNSTLTGAAATFTRTLAGIAGGVGAALAAFGGGVNPGMGFLQGVRGSDGKVYAWGGPGVGDGGVTPQIYLGAGAAQGNVGSGAPLAALAVAFRNAANANQLMTPNMDAAGNLGVQSGGAPAGAAPARALQMGGVDAGAILRALLTDTVGRLILANMAAAGAPAPADVGVIGGIDSGGSARAASISTGGAVSIRDASDVPTGPISMNGLANPQGAGGFVAWTGATRAPFAVTTVSQLFLPDSTGGSAINGVRGQVEVMNSPKSTVDVWVSPSSTTQAGNLYCVRPGGSVTMAHDGPCSVIHEGYLGSTPVGSPQAWISFAEWA